MSDIWASVRGQREGPAHPRGCDAHEGSSHGPVELSLNVLICRAWESSSFLSWEGDIFNRVISRIKTKGRLKISLSSATVQLGTDGMKKWCG